MAHQPPPPDADALLMLIGVLREHDRVDKTVELVPLADLPEHRQQFWREYASQVAAAAWSCTPGGFAAATSEVVHSGFAVGVGPSVAS